MDGLFNIFSVIYMCCAAGLMFSLSPPPISGSLFVILEGV
jgi:hypothetical protein